MTALPSALPFFSVLICNYNYERFVGDAIRSVLAQDYPAERMELIVVDDGSTDGSRAVIASFADDVRVKALSQPNRGQSAAFEAGVRIARGDYLCLLDSDDVFLPHKLARVAARIGQIDAAPDTIFLCHDLTIEGLPGQNSPAYSWFDLVGVRASVSRKSIHEVSTTYPFAIPCGIAISRSLAAAFFESLPAWAFMTGTDGVLCQAALISAGEVHYLHERLGAYRVHGGNEFASLEDGRYMPRIDTRARTPKTLRFLEQWIDLLDLSPARRGSALAYLRLLEHINRMPSGSHRLAEPLVSVVLFTGDDAAALAASIEAAALQSWGAIELVLPAGVTPGPAATTRAVCRFEDDPGASDFERLGRAHGAANGEFVVFVRAGDLLVREFVERHVFVRQRAALVGVSCSDIRLLGPGVTLIHDDVFSNSGAWGQHLQQIPPLAAGLGDWVGVPISACLFRRGELCDRFFGAPGEMSDALRAGGFWLMFQLLQQTAGVLRLRETLTGVALPDAGAASYGYLSAPAGLGGPLPALPVREAALWLQEFFLEHEEAFKRWLPPVWHRDFEPWLDRQTV